MIVHGWREEEEEEEERGKGNHMCWRAFIFGTMA